MRKRAFQEVRLTVGEQVTSSTTIEPRRKRRTRIVMGYCLGILKLSVVLTVTGTMAAQWHLVWWIGVAFFAMVLISQGLVITAIVTSQPPGTAKEQKHKRRSKNEKLKQAQAHDQDDEERA